MLMAACSDNRPYYKIGVSQCASGQWREKVNREMLAAQHLYDQDVEICFANAHDDTELQIRQIDSLTSTDIDLLVVAPTESAPLAETIAKVRKKGIPVIFFDRKATTDYYTAFIGGSNEEAGETVGRYALSVAKELDSGGRKPVILEITGALTSSPAQERHIGFERIMKGQPSVDYTCKSGDWTSEEAYRIVKEEIESGRTPDVVFCHNDGMGTGVFQAAIEAGVEDKVNILGIDGLPGEGIEYVQQGHQRGTYVYPTHGEEIVRLALLILTGKPYERENLLQGMMVTPENVDIISLNSNEMMHEGEHLITLQGKLENYLGLYNTQRKVLMASLVAIALLVVGIVMACRAYILTRRTIRQRQQMNEEQTLFYISPANRKLRQVFEDPKPEPEDVKSQDSIFAETLNEAIRKNMSNPNLKMDDLGDCVGLGRVQLYRKVKAITGQTPVELLRQMRLQQGYTLLQTTTKTINEIAYEVGFNTPSYFSKCFREQYGKYPTELREQAG